MVSPYDRSAPNGTGHVKAGLNYAMSLYSKYKAKHAGFTDSLYLDAATRTRVEETGGANFLFITKDGGVVTPKSSTILPSITRQSLMQIASQNLGLQCEEREVFLSELSGFKECALCGTAAVITPVAGISDSGKEIVFPDSREGMGPVSKKLYNTLLAIQRGEIEGPEGWVHVII
jgi:branched-chain amino acid aminotransferase